MADSNSNPAFSSDEELIASAPRNRGALPTRIRQRIVPLQTAEGTAYTRVTSYEYESTTSTGEAMLKCGIHDFATSRLKEFNEHLALLHTV
jgi:hypothetical protein